jgi:hypothetical protein
VATDKGLVHETQIKVLFDHLGLFPSLKGNNIGLHVFLHSFSPYQTTGAPADKRVAG